jgi:hypothetical protein
MKILFLHDWHSVPGGVKPRPDRDTRRRRSKTGLPSDQRWPGQLERCDHDSRELVRASGLPESALAVVGTDHRLAAPEPLQAMLEACQRAK